MRKRRRFCCEKALFTVYIFYTESTFNWIYLIFYADPGFLAHRNRALFLDVSTDAQLLLKRGNKPIPPISN